MKGERRITNNNKLTFKIDFTFNGTKRRDLPQSDELKSYFFTRKNDHLAGGVLDIQYGDDPLIIDVDGSSGVSDYMWYPFLRILEDVIPAIIDGDTIQVDLFDNPHHLTFVPTYGEDLFVYFISAVSGITPFRVIHVSKSEFFNAVFQCAEETISAIKNFDPEMEFSEIMSDLKSAISRGRFAVFNSRYNESQYPLVSDASIKARLLSQEMIPKKPWNQSYHDCRCNLLISNGRSITAIMERHFTRKKLEAGENYTFNLYASAINILRADKTEESVRLIALAEDLSLPPSYWYTGQIVKINNPKKSLVIDIGAGSIEILLPYTAFEFKEGDFISVEVPITFILHAN